MPANSHLLWHEISQFETLWTRPASQFLMPPNAAQQMDDCYPQVGGGLRAFFAPGDDITLSGMTPASQQIIGLHVDTRFETTNMVSGDVSLFAVTADTVDLDRFRVFENVLDASPSWTLEDDTSGSFLSVENQQLGTFFAEGRNVADDLGGPGTLVLTTPDEARRLDKTNTASQFSLINGPVVTHQSRFCVVSTTNSGGTRHEFQFTDPGGVTLTETLSLNPGTPAPHISLMAPYSPSDLFIVTRGGQIFAIQGDLSDPIVRELGTCPPMSVVAHWAKTPIGIAFMPWRAGVYVLGGSSAVSISETLDATDFANPALTNIGGTAGNVIFAENWIVAPLGHVYDIRTKAWFKYTDFSGVRIMAHDHGSSENSSVDLPRRQIYGATLGNNYTIKTSEFRENENAPRAETWTWKSAPFRDSSGRQVEIREVQLFLNAYNAATSSVTVTVNGTSRTASSLPSGTSVQVLQFSERASHLDVTVTSDSNASTVEAPTLESIRIGYRSGHRLY